MRSSSRLAKSAPKEIAKEIQAVNDVTQALEDEMKNLVAGDETNFWFLTVLVFSYSVYAIW